MSRKPVIAPDDHAGPFLVVRVVDEPRGSETLFRVSAEHKPSTVAAWALREHDTATDKPAGVQVEVVDGSGSVVAEAGG